MCTHYAYPATAHQYSLITMKQTRGRTYLVKQCFYRATLCVSTVFAVARCSSVRLSRWWVVSRFQTAEDIVKLLYRSSSIITVVFWVQATVPNSKGNPFSGGTKYKGLENFAVFDWNRRLSRKRYEIGPWLLWNVNRKSYALYRMVTFSMTLTDP